MAIFLINDVLNVAKTFAVVLLRTNPLNDVRNSVIGFGASHPFPVCFCDNRKRSIARLRASPFSFNRPSGLCVLPVCVQLFFVSFKVLL